MLGGEEDTANEDFTTTPSTAELNDEASEPETTNMAVEIGRNMLNNGSFNNDKIPKEMVATATDSNKKNGGSNVTSRGRKNKLPIITSDATEAKKIRVSVQSDDPKIASSTTLMNEQLTSASRVSYPFDEMFAKLVAYKEVKGHCRVPQNYKDDRKLAAWVKNIRRNQKPGKIVDEKQIEQLNSIGFQWESKAGRPVGATIESGAKSPARKFRKPIEDDED